MSGSATRFEAASIFLIGTDTEDPSGLSWPGQAILQAADVVLHDADIDVRLLEQVPRSCFREAVVQQPPEGDSLRRADVARLRQLAGDGWRVVRLVAGDLRTATEVSRLEAAGLKVRVLTGSARSADRPRPELFPAALNGLAG
ncbi:MAG: hypothetical protein JO038_04930 [Alphaproteobacteria bacterium]|nr:hypothetical protein [Alphaproteobacteria bacterium]